MQNLYLVYNGWSCCECLATKSGDPDAAGSHAYKVASVVSDSAILLTVAMIRHQIRHCLDLGPSDTPTIMRNKQRPSMLL